MNKNIDNLRKNAEEARKNAYIPYSGFAVGAALETDDGEIISGCNVENASYGLSCCAERNAIFKAVSMGKKKFKSIYIVADTEDPVSPCGACRQVLREFGVFDVYLANLKGDIKETNTEELLPYGFSSDDLNEKK
ncbi:MAG TPA: cytidine deaminase [Tepiditoga sp.]|nr:cytidine deaminase [Tepiditoga sp.]